MTYKIKCASDIKELIHRFNSRKIAIIKNSNEVLNLGDLLYFYDNQELELIIN